MRLPQPRVAPEEGGSTDDLSIRRRDTNIITSMFGKASVERNNLDERFRPTILVGLIYFNSPIDVSKLRILVFERLLQFPRFCSYITIERSNIFFQELSPHDVNLEYHIFEENSKGWTDVNVHSFINEKYNEQKDSNVPLWRLHILNNLADGRHCLLTNIDHTIGDGFSIVQSFMSLLDTNDSNPTTTIQRNNSISNKISNLPDDNNPIKIKSDIFRNIYSLPIIISSTLFSFISPLLPGDSKNRLKLSNYKLPSKNKVFAFSEKIPLNSLKFIKNKFENGTINDVCMAVMTMALKKYLLEMDDSILKSYRRVISASFPINMRKPGADIRNTFGNQVALGSFRFDLNSTERKDIFWSVKDQIDRVKLSPQ
eukprot:gene10573-22066_t